jgi:LysR family hydrogen peroxide-inducible transcriptional activator
LQDETLLLLEDGHCLRDQALAVCSQVNMHEKQDFRATSLETLRQMVATGAGVTLLPELATQGAYRHARGVVVRPFARPAPLRKIGGVWRKSTARPAAIAAVCAQITAHAAYCRARCASTIAASTMAPPTICTTASRSPRSDPA